MNDTKSNTRTYNSNNMTDRVKNTYTAIKSNKAVKVILVGMVAVTRLFAIGGLFRVLAWVTNGWNQLTAALSVK